MIIDCFLDDCRDEFVKTFTLEPEHLMKKVVPEEQIVRNLL